MELKPLMVLTPVYGANAQVQTGGTCPRNGPLLMPQRELVLLLKLNKPKSQRMGCNQRPLFNFIPIDHVVIDTLHCLRVADLRHYSCLLSLFVYHLKLILHGPL